LNNESSTSLLVAKTNAATSNQDPQDDPLRVAEIALARLKAAEARIVSLNQMITDKDAIIGAKDQLISVKDQIIANLNRIDTNAQKIDTIGQDSLQIMRDQHRDDKETISDLQKDLASCRSNQKWIFGAGAITGGLVGYKIRGAGQFQNPFQTNSANLSLPSTFFLQSTQEQNLKRALNQLKK
jgi:hypothetical protein